MESTAQHTRRWLGLAAYAGSLLGAGCSTGEGERVVPEGRYHYVATHPGRGDGGSIRLEGVMVVSTAGPDSIAGHWEVPELHPEMDLGAWEAGAYEVMAHPTYFGVITHRIRVGTGPGELLCEGEYTWVARGSAEETVPVACVLWPEGAERPEMPARGAEDPIVRPIDPDSAPPRGAPPAGAGGGGGADASGAVR